MRLAEQFLLTIITVTYNAEAHVVKTIESVLAQAGYADGLTIEYLFVDGNSTDKTMDVIASFQSRFDAKNIAVRTIREPDKGIYDAMNKGVAHSAGRWILMLNAGDVLYDEQVFHRLEDRLHYSDADILYGDYCRKNAYLNEVRHIPPIDTLKNGMILCHQSVLFSNTFHKGMKYDLSYRLDADYHLLLKAYFQGAKFEYLPVCIVYYDLEGLSAKHMLRAYSEENRIRRELGTLENSSEERLRFVIGYSKRFLLSLLPDKLRWKIYHIMKRIQ